MSIWVIATGVLASLPTLFLVLSVQIVPKLVIVHSDYSRLMNIRLQLLALFIYLENNGNIQWPSGRAMLSMWVFVVVDSTFMFPLMQG